MHPQLTASHRGTYDAVFAHPVPRSLDWRELRSMLTALGCVVHEDPSGSIHLLHNGRPLIIRRTTRRNLASVEEVMQVRPFLEQLSNALRAAPAQPVAMMSPAEPVAQQGAGTSNGTGRAGKGGPSGFGRSRN